MACGGPDYSDLSRSERFFQRFRHESDSRVADDLRTWVSRDTGISWDDVWPRVSALARWGVRRMPDSTVVELVRHQHEMLVKTDTTLCGDWVAGQMDSVQAERWSELPDSTSLEWLVRYTVRAALTEVRAQPAPRRLNPVALQDAFRATAEHLPRQDFQRLRGVMSSGSATAASASDRCWAIRLLMRLTEELEPPQRGTLARLITYPRTPYGSSTPSP